MTKPDLQSLEQRLHELDAERLQIVREIAKRSGAKPRTRYHSPIVGTIIQTLEEAGPDGVSSPEIVEEVKAEFPNATRVAVATQLHRMVKRGEITAVGSPGQYRYVAQSAP